MADKEVVERIVYDFSDSEMMQKLKPSMEEASVVQDQTHALDFIGRTLRRAAPRHATRFPYKTTSHNTAPFPRIPPTLIRRRPSQAVDRR